MLALQREFLAPLPDSPTYAGFKKESDRQDRVVAKQRIQLDRINASIESFRSDQLLREAIKFDVKIPFEDHECWRETEPIVSVLLFSRGELNRVLRVLSPHGRSVLRSKIDAEKARRFEVKTLWVTKFWLPLLAALVGIIGAVTGLVAVLQRK
jgi:hypothetical protein